MTEVAPESSPKINKLEKLGPTGSPVHLVVVVRRHAQKGPDGITEQGRIDAVTKGAEASNDGDFSDSETVRGVYSPMPRSSQTVEAFLDGLGSTEYQVNILPITPSRPREVLLGFASAGGPDTFWGVEGDKFSEALAEYNADTNPDKQVLTSDEIEAPIIVNWLNGTDKELGAIYDPEDAAADASVPMARIIASLGKRGPNGQPLVKESTGLVAITHRGAFEPLLVSGVLLSQAGDPITDINELGGPPSFLGGFRFEVFRNDKGRISPWLEINDIGPDKITKIFEIDLVRLNNLYQRGIQRQKSRRAI